METMLRNKKKIILITVFFIFLVVGGFFLFRKKTTTKEEKKLVTPTPTQLNLVDRSVKVSLTPVEGGREVLLKITNIPSGTEEIEYILSYETEEGGLQGVNSNAKVSGSVFEKKITLGTCSSGTCVYHKVKGKIRVELSFRGRYGEKYFSADYDLK